MFTKNKIVQLIGILLIVMFPLGDRMFSEVGVVHAQGEELTLHVEINGDWVSGENWPLGHLVRLTINGIEKGSQEAFEDSEGYTYVNFNSWDTGFEYDIVPGDEVVLEDTVTGISKTHTAQDIAITEVNVIAMTVKGYAPAGSSLIVWAHAPCWEEKWVTASVVDGIWTATFDCDLSEVEYFHLELYGTDETTLTTFFWSPPSHASNPVQVYFNDFDEEAIVMPGVTAILDGVTNLESVQGYDRYGFGGNFLRNDTGGYDDGGIGMPGSPTTLTLTGLPPHTSIDVNFLLAIIDSWDGSAPGEGQGACIDCHPDIFNITVDGIPIFSGAFGYNGPVFEPPPGVLLKEGKQLGFNLDFDDAAYDMGLNPVFYGIPHSASTLTIAWFANGNGWQGGGDESWAIDNLEIVLDGNVDIDIKPDGDPNSINLSSNGVVPVAILTTDNFDAVNVDPVSVRFADASPLRWVMEDVDHDGDMDLLFHFKTQELNLEGNSTEATLTGLSILGIPIKGVDAVVPVGKLP